MEKTSGKKKIEWEIPLLVRLSNLALDASGLCDNGSGDLGNCTYGSDAMGTCNTGYNPKVI